MNSRGFTLIELLTSIFIIVVMAAIILTGLVSYRKHQALDEAAHGMVAFLDEARRKTLASEFDSRYGIHFDVSQIVLYKNTYTVGDPSNKILTLDAFTTISATNIAGGGSEIIFDRLTGKTANAGTITVALKSDLTKNKVITVTPAGVIERN